MLDGAMYGTKGYNKFSYVYKLGKLPDDMLCLCIFFIALGLLLQQCYLFFLNRLL